MYVCMYVCMYNICIKYICIFAADNNHLLHVCMYIYIHTHIYIHIYIYKVFVT